MINKFFQALPGFINKKGVRKIFSSPCSVSFDTKRLAFELDEGSISPSDAYEILEARRHNSAKLAKERQEFYDALNRLQNANLHGEAQAANNDQAIDGYQVSVNAANDCLNICADYRERYSASAKSILAGEEGDASSER